MVRFNCQIQLTRSLTESEINDINTVHGDFTEEWSGSGKPDPHRNLFLQFRSLVSLEAFIAQARSTLGADLV